MKAFINGADDYIVKPFNVAEVSERIVRLIHQCFFNGKGRKRQDG
ncbi:hypothetical protein [Lysinibacillus sp. JK80]|nr:hypothetical protein [Lysinibacillus sp. JK80]